MKEQYAQELAKIFADNEVVTAEMVLDKAKPAKSPLHDYFEWDDEAAAKAYRILSARSLIREFEIEIGGERVRAAQSFKIHRQHGGGYESTRKVVANPDKMILLEKEAEEECIRFVDRFYIRFPLNNRLPKLFALLRLLRKEASGDDLKEKVV